MRWHDFSSVYVAKSVMSAHKKWTRSLVTVGPGHADYVKNMITGVSWRQGLGCTREDNVDVVS